MRDFCARGFVAAVLLSPIFIFGFTPQNPRSPISDRDSGHVAVASQPAGITVTGELRRWHPITITLDGPQSSETSTPNPFLDYRFEVVFSLAEVSITVPGYFAADGDAASTSASIGNQWRAHFTPPLAGNWTYRTQFREGTDVAVSTDPGAGTPNQYDNVFGSISIAESNKSGRDFRGKGVLRYNEGHYLQFDNGDHFIKGGTDSPENLLAFEDFDATYNNGGTNFIKSYTAHVADWNSGDPTWQNGKGKGLIGALNYLASEGMNSVYFLTMNVQGDGQDVWPWASPTDFLRFDISKLDQWNIVFDHMDQLGLALHVVTQETENELLLNNGELGRARKVYYRELIARFGHHPALFWNLGEENDQNTTSQRKSFATYIRTLDPYDHPIVIHTFPGQYDDVYGPLLNFEDFEGPSLQTSTPDKTHSVTLDWLQRSSESGRPWYVAIDEAGPWTDGVTPDGPGNNHDVNRKDVLWGHLMAGGGGVEWYFGFNHPDNDLTAEDWRTRDDFWDYTRHALSFFHDHLPFTQMESADALSSRSGSYVLANTGSTYAIYLPDGGSTNLDLESNTSTYTVRWFNPRSGGALQTGTVTSVTGPNSVSIGNPPSQVGQDWVALVSTDDGVTYGDVSLNGGVSAQDASLILQHTTGIQSLNGQQQAPADVSGNGDISAFDASLILQYVTGLISCFPAEPGCGSGKRHDDSGTIDTEFSWDSQHRALRLEEPVAASSMELVVSNVSEREANLFAFKFPEGWTELRHVKDQTLYVSAAGLPATISGVLATSRGTHEGSSVQIQLDEREVQNVLLDEKPETIAGFELKQNYPNPVLGQTTIPFSLEQDSWIELEIFDATGRRVLQLASGQFTQGSHTVNLNAGDLPSGLYVYRLRTESGSLSRKLTLIR